jgi:parvulin-like peptidyl-prolyl isomerase
LNENSEHLGRKGLIQAVALYLVLVGLIIGLPYYWKILAPRRQVVLQVGDVSITSQDLIKRLRLSPPQGGSNQLESVTSLLQEIQNQELIRQEALKQKITLSQEELDREIKRRVTASAPAEGKFEELYGSLLRRLGLTEKEFQAWVEADIFRGKLFQAFFQKTPDQAEHIRLSVIVLGTAAKAEEIRIRLQKGEDFARMARENSIDLASAKRGGDFGWIPKGVDELTTPGQVLAQGILSKTRAEAEEIRKHVLAGRDLGKLAREYSLDKESGKKDGSLGWVSADFQEGRSFGPIVFELNPGDISPPVQSPEGFWIIKLIDKSPRGKVIDDLAFQLPLGRVSPPLSTLKGFYFLKPAGREVRPLTSEHKAALGGRAFSEWLAAAAERGRKEGRIKWNWGSEIYNWVVSHLN